MQRQEAIAAIIAIITGLFLRAMDGVLGVIEVKDDELGWAGVGGEGICLRRDNWVSVRYAEELNSGKSSATLQRADRHGILGQKSPHFQESL